MSEIPPIQHLDAYHAAIVRIATVRTGKKTPHLVFASVELVTSNRPTPESTPVSGNGVPQIKKLRRQNGELAFRRVALTASAAVDWYRSLHQTPTLPVPQAERERGKHDGSEITAYSLADEPSWPALSTPLADPSLFGSGDDFYPTPFIGSGAQPARIHRSLAKTDEKLLELFDDAEVCQWLQKRIHFDISRHDELLGGAVLVVPDPDVRKISSFMTRDQKGKECLVAEVLPHFGRSFNGLEMTLFEERFGTMSLFETFTVGSDLIVAEAPDQLEHAGYALWQSDRGLISQQKAVPFIREIAVDTSAVNRRVRLETKIDRRKGRDTASHEIHEFARSTQNIINVDEDAPKKREIAARFYNNSYRRQRERTARQQEIQWFDSRAAATKFIRERISRARETVMIVDPFADSLDLFNFGHFVTRTDIILRLLTSRLAFDGKSPPPEHFKETTRSFLKRSLSLPDIRIMKGRRNPVIHDRFLVIDGIVWLSGNSLNRIGERASMIVKLPHPDDVLERLEDAFEEAEKVVMDGDNQ